jgi:hypothetical protein
MNAFRQSLNPLTYCEAAMIGGAIVGVNVGAFTCIRECRSSRYPRISNLDKICFAMLAGALGGVVGGLCGPFLPFITPGLTTAAVVNWWKP